MIPTTALTPVVSASAHATATTASGISAFAVKLGSTGTEQRLAGGTGMNGTKARPPQDAAVLLRPERDAVASWLLGAAKDFDEAQCQWEEFGIALLACGGVFSVVRLTDTLVHTAAGSTEPAEVDAFLRMSLDGPTFVDTYSGVYYVLVPTGVEQRWCLSHPPDVEFLGRNSYLGVPAPERTDPAQTRWHWCVPMDSPGRLCAPAVVWQVVRAGYRPVEESGW